jgi:hypothetical protein
MHATVLTTTGRITVQSLMCCVCHVIKHEVSAPSKVPGFAAVRLLVLLAYQHHDDHFSEHVYEELIVEIRNSSLSLTHFLSNDRTTERRPNKINNGCVDLLRSSYKQD